MLERKELNRLVIKTLNETEEPIRASVLYCHIRQKKESVFKTEKVRTFKSFVKIINSFPEVKAIGTGTKKYILK